MTTRRFRNRDIYNLPMPAALLLALVFSLLTTLLLVVLNNLEHINNTTIALMFLIPVGISASVWGLIPGIEAAFVSFLAFNFFFIPDLYTFQVKQTEDLIVLAAFLSVATVISELTGRIRHNLATASAREFEALRLYELNTLLTGAQDEQSAGRILLDKIEQVVQPERIEILIESRIRPALLVRGEHINDYNTQRPFVIPLQTSRELIGEIRLWSNQVFAENETRLLSIFASQFVLTIERIRLGEVARKSLMIEESDRMKTTLLSSVSHELRSPLAAIKASVSSLRSGEIEWENEARKELLTTVEEEIDHLNVLVGNLLDMSRIEAGVLKPQKKPNILSEILSASLGRLKLRAQDFILQVNVPEDLPLINVDFVQLQQVFTNLLSNSIKFSPRGSKITISANRRDDNYLLVRIENQSSPLPEADMERIYDKFYRFNPSERITGEGLGLSICKGIIEAHGGNIWAENLVNGLAFSFTIPIK